MIDPFLLLILVAAATLAVAGSTAAALRVWRDWLSLKRLELGRDRPASPAAADLADLRHRIRRLESIADGEA